MSEKITSWVQFTQNGKGDLTEAIPRRIDDELIELGVGGADIPLFSSGYRDIVPRSRCHLSKQDTELNIGV